MARRAAQAPGLGGVWGPEWVLASHTQTCGSSDAQRKRRREIFGGTYSQQKGTEGVVQSIKFSLFPKKTPSEPGLSRAF